MIIFKGIILNTYIAPKGKGGIVTACGNSLTIASRKEGGKYLAKDSERVV